MKNQRRTAGLKKILTVMLCAALVFGLAACGGKKNPGGTTKTPTYQAKFDPYYLHPGLAEGSDWTTADGGQSGFHADVSDLRLRQRLR